MNETTGSRGGCASSAGDEARDGEVRAHIEIERHRAFAYTEDGKSVMDLAVSSVRGARSRADGYGLADDASRKAVLENIMLLLPVYLPG